MTFLTFSKKADSDQDINVATIFVPYKQVFRDSGKRNLNHYCQAANLKLLPRKGTAVLWYNHFVNETTGWMGAVDKLTWHGGCPVVRGNKWIMNRWIAATPERDQDLKITNQVEV